MSNLAIETITGASHDIGNDELDALKNSLRGSVSMPGDEDYDEVRSVWNGMIDRYPALVVRCKGASDVMQGVRFAAEHDLLLAIKGGGHNIAGKGTCDRGMLLDLSSMTSVHIDPVGKIGSVEPGALLADFDREAQAFGLMTPLGINSTTGVAGLTLGGGFGWTTRKYGFTVDNLIGADVVTATGELVHASESENSDLFWAIRGGGGNFGVVTRFQYRLHHIGNEVLSGVIVHPFDDAPGLFDQYLDFVAEMPDELTCWAVLRKAPPFPFVPEAWHGKMVMILAACYVGDIEEGEKVLAPLRALGTPLADVISPHGYCDWNAAFDPLLTNGARNYWKSHDFSEINSDARKAILDFASRLPSDECEIFVAHLGGASNRIATDATAYAHRDKNFVLNVHTRWQEPQDDASCIDWARDFFDSTAAYADGSVYVNFMADDETERVGEAYGANFERLVSLKQRFDPSNRFRVNQNILPG